MLVTKLNLVTKLTTKLVSVLVVQYNLKASCILSSQHMNRSNISNRYIESFVSFLYASLYPKTVQGSGRLYMDVSIDGLTFSQTVRVGS